NCRRASGAASRSRSPNIDTTTEAHHVDGERRGCGSDRCGSSHRFALNSSSIGDAARRDHTTNCGPRILCSISVRPTPGLTRTTLVVNGASPALSYLIRVPVDL